MPGRALFSATTVASTLGLAVLGEHGGVGLARDAARFKSQLAAAPFNFHALCVEHLSISFLVVESVAAPQLPLAEAGPHCASLKGDVSAPAPGSRPASGGFPDAR